MGFSRGKDSIAAWLQLKRYFTRIIPFHVASVPHLSFVDESLAYYEKVFDTPILRLMDGEVIGAVAQLMYQPGEDEAGIDGTQFRSYDKRELFDALRRHYKLPKAWSAWGLSMSDSIERRFYVMHMEGINEAGLTFYPCWDWSRQQKLDVIDAAGIKLPKDYLLASRSLAGVPRYRHLFRMSTDPKFAEDFQRIEEMFPLIRAELARYEFRIGGRNEGAKGVEYQAAVGVDDNAGDQKS